MPSPSKPSRTVAFVEREIYEGGNPYGGGKLSRISLAVPADPRLRIAILPDARVGRYEPDPEPESHAPRAIVMAEAIPKLHDWIKKQPMPLTTQQIADHPDMTGVMGKPMTRSSIHGIFAKMLERGLVTREYVRVWKEGDHQKYSGIACLWSAAK